jgi:hypothetical protein
MWDMKSGYLVEWQVKKQQNSRPNNLILNDEIEKKNQFKKKQRRKKLCQHGLTLLACHLLNET